MEEDGEDASNGSAEVWDEPYEAPFWRSVVFWDSGIWKHPDGTTKMPAEFQQMV